jgi:hypothetical protein
MKRKQAHEYLVKTGLSRKYWGRKIIAAEKIGYFPQLDVNEAAQWTTCACGRQDPRIPRVIDVAGELAGPKDKKLATAGMDFYIAVREHDFWEAAYVLNTIESRARVVLQKELRYAQR